MNLARRILDTRQTDSSLAAVSGLQEAGLDHGAPDTPSLAWTQSRVQLLERTALWSARLRQEGIEPDQRVLLGPSRGPELVALHLAVLSSGAVVVPLNSSLSTTEVEELLPRAQPSLIVTSPDIARRHAAAAGNSGCRWLTEDELSLHEHQGPTLSVESRQPADTALLLFTSGTTGQPKGVVRDNGGHLVALTWSMPNIYGIGPGEVYWAASDVGWVVGHSYIVYAPLFNGSTTVLFEGKPVGTPDAGVFWRVISEHGVKALFTAPTAFRAIKKEDPDGTFIGQYDLSRFETLFLAGERADSATIKWAERHLGVPVLDHWWQTETGWAIAANCIGLGQLPVKYGSPTKAVPGWELRAVDASANEVEAGKIGALVARLPMPPGCLPTLWNADARYIEAYLEDFPGYYKTADAGYIDEDGYVFVMSRTDDIINVAGHRLSTGAMEEVLTGHPDVAECAVIGVADEIKGQVPLGFLVLKSGVAREPADVTNEAVSMVRRDIGPVAAFKTATVVERLPKTRSGKILRGTMSAIADGEAWKMPATIDDPAILDEIAVALRDIGYADN